MSNMTTKSRRLSGVRATGRLHLGNYLGALKQWVAHQDQADNYFFIADLHGLTDLGQDHDAEGFRFARLNTIATYIGAGIDPNTSTLFLQSDVAQHTELMWYMATVARKSELERMTQWKDKRGKEQSASAALFFYPTLMAADILLYDADEVPVGDDQTQHVEIARDWAIRFNSYFGTTFVVPRAVIPQSGARVMDLQDPRSKMSKSAAGEDGTIFLDDSDESIARKIRRAVTDSAGVVAHDPERPGIANLVDLYATLSGSDRGAVEDAFGGKGYGDFKVQLADLVIGEISGLREQTAELRKDPGELSRLLSLGTDRATSVAEATCERARSALGLGPI